MDRPPATPQPKSSGITDPDTAVQIIKDIAVDSAARGADRDWLTSAQRAVRVLATRQQYLTSDDVWQWLRPLELATPDNRAMGSVMQGGYRDRLIEPTGDWRISERAVCHGRPIRVWKSLRYVTPPDEIEVGNGQRLAIQQDPGAGKAVV